MCGRYASQLPAEFISQLFRTTNPLPNPRPTWNMAPTQKGMVVRRHPDIGERHLDLLKWGLIPPFEKVIKKVRRPMNARSETASASCVSSLRARLVCALLLVFLLALGASTALDMLAGRGQGPDAESEPFQDGLVLLSFTLPALILICAVSNWTLRPLARASQEARRAGPADPEAGLTVSGGHA